MDESSIWEEVLSNLQSELDESEIKTWLEPLSIVDLRGDMVTLSAPNKFYKKNGPTTNS